MIKTTIKDGKTFASMDELFRWAKNPKLVTKDGFERLKKYINKFGQFKPLVVTPTGEILGGNSRYEVFKDLGIKEAWVSIVEPTGPKEKLEIALADNDEVGQYIEEELAQLVSDLEDDPIELKDYKVNIGKSIDLKQLMDSIGPTGDIGLPDNPDKPKKMVTCPNCGEEIEI